MSAFRTKMRHAFAVDPPGAAVPTPEQAEVVDRICRQIVKRRLTTPGLLMLEVFRPLNYLGAQMGHVVAPGIWAIVREETHEAYCDFLRFLEQRGSMEYMGRRIEAIEAECVEREKASAGVAPENEESDDEDRS